VYSVIDSVTSLFVRFETRGIMAALSGLICIYDKSS
jgi:hypothetical protein